MTREEAVEQLESLLRLLNEIMDMPIGWGQVKPPVHPDDVSALDMAIAALREQESLAEKQATSDWISVEEQMPGAWVDVLAFVPGVGCEVAWFGGAGNLWRWAWTGESVELGVTHWMPLPEPPEEDTNA